MNDRTDPRLVPSGRLSAAVPVTRQSPHSSLSTEDRRKRLQAFAIELDGRAVRSPWFLHLLRHAHDEGLLAELLRDTASPEDPK